MSGGPLVPPAFMLPPRYARDAADVEREAVVARATAERCGTSASAARLPHMTTRNVARDLDRIRAALGEQRISYLGYSYGTYLGAVYATLFPGRTDRVVFDSATGPTGVDDDASRRWALGMELRFPDFGRWAADRHDEYGFGRTPGQVRATYLRLAERLDRTPASGVDGALFRWLTFGYLSSDATFVEIAKLWQMVEQGVMVNQTAAAANPFDFSGFLHIICNDSNWPSDLATYQRAVERDRVRFPLFGAAAANVWPCAFWPSEQLEPAVRIDDRGPSNILIMQNLRDNGTTYPSALEMRQALGQRARLVTVDRGGHLIYLHGVSQCADDIVTAYLVSGRRPARDSFCQH